MSTVSLVEAKNRLSELVKRAEAGERITVTRRGRPVARLVAADTTTPGAQEAQVADALALLARLRVGKVLEGDLKSIAREGLD